MLIEFNCNGRARWQGATATTMPVGSKQCLKHGNCNMPASLVKLYRHNCLVSDMYAGPVPHNQTCVMVNMSELPPEFFCQTSFWQNDLVLLVDIES